MKSFSFDYGPKVASGAGMSAQLATWLPEGTVLFVTDRHVLELGLATPALDGLAASGRQVAIFDAVEADPSRATLEAAEGEREAGVQSVVGVERGHLDMLADDAMLRTRLLRNNPCAITRDDARRLYEAAV